MKRRAYCLACLAVFFVSLLAAENTVLWSQEGKTQLGQLMKQAMPFAQGRELKATLHESRDTRKIVEVPDTDKQDIKVKGTVDTVLNITPTELNSSGDPVKMEVFFENEVMSRDERTFDSDYKDVIFNLEYNDEGVTGIAWYAADGKDKLIRLRQHHIDTVDKKVTGDRSIKQLYNILKAAAPNGPVSEGDSWEMSNDEIMKYITIDERDIRQANMQVDSAVSKVLLKTLTDNSATLMIQGTTNCEITEEGTEGSVKLKYEYNGAIQFDLNKKMIRAASMSLRYSGGGELKYETEEEAEPIKITMSGTIESKASLETTK